MVFCGFCLMLSKTRMNLIEALCPNKGIVALLRPLREPAKTPGKNPAKACPGNTLLMSAVGHPNLRQSRNKGFVHNLRYGGPNGNFFHLEITTNPNSWFQLVNGQVAPLFFRTPKLYFFTCLIDSMKPLIVKCAHTCHRAFCPDVWN